jgi:hypothetical protein
MIKKAYRKGVVLVGEGRRDAHGRGNVMALLLELWSILLKIIQSISALADISNRVSEVK